MAQPTASMKKVALLIAQGASIPKAAKNVGVSENTIQKWKREKPEFLDELQKCHRLIYDEALQRAVQNAKRVVDYVVSVVFDEKEDTKVRLQASKQIIDAAGMFIERDQESRIRKLEEALESA